MIDGHIHIERGEYTLDWLRRFTDRAVETGLSEIRLLEHCYRFTEFVPMYKDVCAASGFVDAWFRRCAGVCPIRDYLALIDRARGCSWPVRLRFGLEICYFPEQERFIQEQTRGCGFDFLLGSVHFVDGFAFDHRAELWSGLDCDSIFRRYYEISVRLAKSGLFDGIGHPDQIGMFGHRPSFSLTDAYAELARAVSESSMYADQNSGAARRCPGTANLGIGPELLAAFKNAKVPLVPSSDAHCPEDVGWKIRELELSACKT